MLAKYNAITDCIYPIGTEALFVPAGEDQIKGGNLLTSPHDASQWNDWNSGDTSSYGDIAVKLKNLSPGSANGSSYRLYATDSTKWYVWRAYCTNPENSTDTSARLIVSTTQSGTELGASDYINNYKQVVFQGTGSNVYLQIQNETSIQDSTYWSRIELLEITVLGVDETTTVLTDNFNADITGWTDDSDAGGSIAWNASGYLDLINTTGTARATNSFTTVSGDIYSITIIKVDANNSNMYIGTTAGASDIRSIALSAAGTYTYYFAAQGTTTYIRLTNGGAGTTVQYDSILSTLSGNLVTNGDFTDTTNKDWNEGTGWTISGGTATHSAGTASLSYPATPVYNGEYIVKYTISGYSAGTVYPGMNGGDNGTQRSANGTYTETLTAGSGSLFGFNPSTDFVGSIDDVTIIKAVTDISTNADGMEIHGEVVTVPVNFDADTVAWSNFTANNYLEQPYNSNLDYGVTGFHVKGWFRTTGTSEAIFTYGVYSGGWSGGFFRIYVNSSGQLYLQISDDGLSTSDTITSTQTINDNEWHHFCGVVTGDGASPGANAFLNLYIDGSSAATQVTVSAATGSLTNTSATARIGLSQAAASSMKGQIAMISTGATVVTAQQVKNFYEYEKPLFYQDSCYSILDTEISYEYGLIQSHPTMMENIIQTDSVDGTAIAITVNYQKDGFIGTSLLVPQNQLKYAKRFLKQARRQTFTFDERGKLYAAYDPVQVVMESNSKPTRTGRGNWYSFGFTLRMTR